MRKITFASPTFLGGTQMILVITEKPSVALAVSKVLGAYKREDGYYEGSGYIVSWCV